MPSLFLDTAGRRRLLLRLAGLAAAVGAARPASAPDLDNATLLAACAAFGALERERLALFEGPGRIEDDDERDEAIGPIWARQVPLLEQICARRATTLAGHRARAAAYWLWDGGELAWRARAAGEGSLDDRLLAALVADLAGTR